MSKPDQSYLTPDGKPFPWGTILQMHAVGEYRIAEYEDSRTGRVLYHGWVAGQDTSSSWTSLDEALIFLIAYSNTEPNYARHATQFAARGLGLKETT